MNMIQQHRDKYQQNLFDICDFTSYDGNILFIELGFQVFSLQLSERSSESL